MPNSLYPSVRYRSIKGQPRTTRKNAQKNYPEYTFGEGEFRILLGKNVQMVIWVRQTFDLSKHIIQCEVVTP